MGMVILPYLNQIFPQDELTSLDEILDGVPSDVILRLASFVNSKLYIKDRYSTHREIFNTIVFQQGINNAEEINNNLVLFERSYISREQTIFPLYNVLLLIEHVIVNRNNEDKFDFPHKELAFLKAILFLNKKLDEKHSERKYSNSIHLIWAAAFPQFEYRRNKNPINEMFLAFSLFDFLEKRFPHYFEKYLMTYKCSNSKELIKEILSLIVHSFNNQSKLQSCSFTPDSFSSNTILGAFILDLSNLDLTEYISTNKHRYFKGLREKPILRLLDGNYVVTNWNFISDKVRQSVIYDFYNNPGLDIPFSDYKSILGLEYSEKDLFIFLINELYGQDEHAVMYTESDREDWNFDFYLRLENKILIFEFKDVTISEAVKNSDGEQIWKELKKKLVKNERGRAKGITQLANLVNKINSTPDWVENYPSMDLPKERLIIMPIILYTDESLGIPAVNIELRAEFEKQLEKNDFYMVYKPVLIGVNAIVEYLYHLQGSPQKLINLIHDYYLFKASYNFNQNGVSDFQVFEKKAISFDLFLAYKFGAISKWEESISLKIVKERLELQ